MQDEKNRTTPGQKTEKKRRRRKKPSAAASTPVTKAETPSEAAAPESTEASPEESAQETEKDVQEEAVVEPEKPETAEPAQPVEAVEETSETEEKPEEEAKAEPEPATEEPEEEKTEAPEEEKHTPEAEQAAAEEKAEAAEPEQPAPAGVAEPGEESAEQKTESPEPQENEPENPEPAETEEGAPAGEPQEEKPAEEAPAATEKQADETAEEPTEEGPEEDSGEELPEEDEQRLSDLTRTVQLSVEQIMSRVSEEETSEETTDVAPETPETEAAEEETPATLQEYLRNRLSGMAKWFLLVLFIVLVIAGFGVAWLYRSATPDMLPQITVTFAGQTLEPTAYKWKVPVIGNVFKRTYADTISSKPLELSGTVEQVSPDFVVSPSDYRTELTVTDANENVIFEGDTDTFSSFQFTANGNYTAKLVVYSDASSVPGDASVTGNETWYFNFAVGVRPSMRLSSTSVNQGSVVAVRVGDTLDGQKPTLQTELQNSGFFKASSGWVCYLPIAWNQPAETQKIVVTAGGYTEELELKIQAANWGYKDYSSNSQRVSPYIGQNDIPAELQKLLTQSEQAIAWSNGGFVQPFLNTLDVKLAFGTTEYVGRSYSQRNSNNGAGGRTLTNLVLDTTAGELLIAPASGQVLLAKDLGGDFGYTLIIDHGAGVKSIFYNLQKINVKAGAVVKQGQTLATCNKTTVAEVRIGTVPVDPLQIWRGQCDALKYY